MHFVGYDQLHGFAERYVGDHISNYFGGLNPCDHGTLRGPTGRRAPVCKSPATDRAPIRYWTKTSPPRLWITSTGSASGSGADSTPSRSPYPLGFMLPHPPFVARKEDYDPYVGKVPMPRVREPYSDKLHPYFQWWRKRTNTEDVTDDEIMRSRTAYWGLRDPHRCPGRTVA